MATTRMITRIVTPDGASFPARSGQPVRYGRILVTENGEVGTAIDSITRREVSTLHGRRPLTELGRPNWELERTKDPEQER